MTISLLRRIWQRIYAETAAASPKQRLTGFEPLEPRMVLSGFVAYSTPDYLSPPPGDFTHIDRSGAEIARPKTAFGGYSDYNGLGHGFAAVQQYQSAPTETIVLYSFNSPGERIFVGRGFDFWFGEGWNAGPSGAPPITRSAPQLSFSSPLTAETPDSEAEYVGSTVHEATVLPSVSLSGPGYPGGYAAINPSAIDKLLDIRSLPPQIISLPMNGSEELRNFTQLSASAERRYEREFDHEIDHEYVTPSHLTGSDASLALTVRSSSSSLDRGVVNSTTAALSGQSIAPGDSITVQTADGSTVNTKVNTQTNDSSIRQQASLTELTEAERLNLKRRLAAGAATLEEAARSSNDREQFDESDAQIAYDATRPFDVAAIPAGQIRQLAAANVADDGLIEVLAADVTTVLASGEVIDQAVANRQIAMEPAVATYQAFETIVDGDSQAADIASDAARLAVAMNAQPVVQAE